MIYRKLNTSLQMISLLFFNIYIAFCKSNSPNIIFLLVDDQDYVFNSSSFMTNTLKYIGDQGIEFNNAFIHTPVCCPSRTETITGRYLQNILYDGLNNCMNIAAEYNLFNNSQSIFQLFQNNGYLTASFGKVTNNDGTYWCKQNTPKLKGFNRINSPCQQNYYQLEYFDYYNSNSTKQSTYSIHNISQSPNNYLTSYIGNQTLEWLSSIKNQQKPFMIWLGPHAPHNPATPAEWYGDRFMNETAIRTPNFNVHVDNHHDFISSNPKLNGSILEFVDQLYRDRLRSLLSVDDLVHDLIEYLECNNILNNTFILYASDHGYHIGQFALPFSKRMPYEFDIRIPMYLRGPNIKANQKLDAMVSNIDILPTLLDLAGISYDDGQFDGRSWIGNIISLDDSDNNNKNNNNNIGDEWRDRLMIQYQSFGTQDASFIPTWFPDNKTGALYPGSLINPPCCDEYNSKAYMIDIGSLNNWRAMRILNETVNCIYIEFIDLGHNPTKNWTQDVLENNIYFYEFYDINSDPYQIDNIYDYLPQTEKDEYHQLIIKYGTCKGKTCW